MFTLMSSDQFILILMHLKLFCGRYYFFLKIELSWKENLAHHKISPNFQVCSNILMNIHRKHLTFSILIGYLIISSRKTQIKAFTHSAKVYEVKTK